MAERRMVTLDGNEATASVAHRINEVIAIYPITPSSNMGEWADEWSAQGKKNIWGTVPARGGDAVRGRRRGRRARRPPGRGPDHHLHRLPGPAADDPQHVQDRRRAHPVRHARGRPHPGHPRPVHLRRPLRRHGLPADRLRHAVPPTRCRRPTTSPSSPRPPRSKSRVPFLHFFDGFRTSPRGRQDRDAERRRPARHGHRRDGRRGTAAAPSLRTGRCCAAPPRTRTSSSRPGKPATASITACPGIVQEDMDGFAKLTGRQYQLFDYFGHPEAERVIVIMGSGAETADETVEWAMAKGEKVGVLKVRLFRPFSIKHFARRPADDRQDPGGAGPQQGARRLGEPLYLDVVTGAAAKPPMKASAGRRGAPGHRRPLRALQQGIHPRHGQGRLRRDGRDKPKQPLHRGHHGRRHRHLACPWTWTSTSRPRT